jgi:hypothetical protein
VMSASCSANSSDRSGSVVFIAFSYRRLLLRKSSAQPLSFRYRQIRCSTATVLGHSDHSALNTGNPQEGMNSCRLQTQSSTHTPCAVRCVPMPFPNRPNSTARGQQARTTYALKTAIFAGLAFSRIEQYSYSSWRKEIRLHAVWSSGLPGETLCPPAKQASAGLTPGRRQSTAARNGWDPGARGLLFLLVVFVHPLQGRLFLQHCRALTRPELQAVSKSLFLVPIHDGF